MTKQKKLTTKDVLAFFGATTIVVITALTLFALGAKTVLAFEPYVKGYDIEGYETRVVCQGETLYEIAEKHLDNFPETGKENRLKCYVMCIAQYNGIYEPSSELRWGETIKLPIVTGSKTANLKSVG